MVWPIMGDACRRSIHLKDGVEASQRVRSSGRSAPSSTVAFNEQSGNCSGPEVLFKGMSSEKHFSPLERQKCFPDIQPPALRQTFDASSSLWFHARLHDGAISVP